MIDEAEAHLHPKWQRVILPALLEVTTLLSAEIKPQMIIATHSPLILASMESMFSATSDKLFHLYLNSNAQPDKVEVQLDEVQYYKHGSVDAWLTSEIFELKQARSQEGEVAMEAAKKLLAESAADATRIRDVDQQLRRVLPPEDLFWPRWLHFANSKGIKL
jgi:hypothetical protein